MFLRRVLGILISCWFSIPACAFTFSYGSLLDVKDVKNDGGVLVLPLTNKKSTNVKVLSKEVYDFLQRCQKDCTYEVKEKAFVSTDFRPATGNQQMLIAEVQLNGALQLTVLAFKNKDSISVRFPAAVVFKDKNLQQDMQQYVTQLAQQTL